MTPSTTNTAARENLARDTRTIVSDLQSARDRLMPVLTEQYGDAFDGDFDSMLEAINALKRFATATLTQQQGGEQEARELLALECGFDPDSCGKFEGAVVSEAGALRAIAAALQAGTPT